MIRSYYNDTVTLKKVKKDSDGLAIYEAGKVTYEAEKTIGCYFSQTKTEIKTSLSEVKISDAQIFTEDAEINENDFINGQLVLKVDVCKCYNGKYYKAYI